MKPLTFLTFSKMKIQISNHKIKHFKEMFDPRTYKNFLAIVKGILALRDWKQADIALYGEKTLRQVEFFLMGRSGALKYSTIFV